MSASGRGTVPRKFLSTPSARRATATVKDLALELVISIHALREEGDGRHLRRVIVGADISIHALREEGDATSLFAQILSILFLSTPSARRATSLWETYLFAVVEFLSTPSARRATRKM
mgnify:CR=1 FL=1